jgi:hypothetical protein
VSSAAAEQQIRSFTFDGFFSWMIAAIPAQKPQAIERRTRIPTRSAFGVTYQPPKT